PSRSVSTSSFNGLPVNNSWYLYARDTEAVAAGYIDEWTITIYYTDPADLVTQSLTVTPTSGTPDSTVNVSFTIRNNGGTTANPSTANIRLATSSSNVTTSDPLLTSVSVPSIGANGTHPVNVNVTIPSGRAAGQNYVWVILDT